MYTHTLIDPSLAYIDMTEDQLFNLWLVYYPAVSGPIGMLKTTCALIESLASLRGFDPSCWPQRAQQRR